MADAPDTDDSQGPSLLYREEGVFHPDAVETVEVQTEQFRERLETTAVRLADQQQADSVSRTHVRRAYDTLVPPARSVLRWRQFVNVAFGAVASAIVSVLIALFRQKEGMGLGQALFLFALICALAFFSYQMDEE